MDAPGFAMETGAVLVGSESTANVGRGAGLPEDRIRVIRNADTLQFGTFRVTFFESVHGRALFGKVPYPGEIREPVVPPAPVSAYRAGLVFGIRIEHPVGTLIQTGSAGYLPGQWDAVTADVALLCIAGRSNSADLIRNLAIATGAREVIPIHFDDLFGEVRDPPDFLIGVDFAEFVRTVRENWPGLRIRTLPVGKRVRVLPVG
jgi:L-ascorbate metabolism protein UlaG (beta-lactamase superfamily)